jgi:hypothetical protein
MLGGGARGGFSKTARSHRHLEGVGRLGEMGHRGHGADVERLGAPLAGNRPVALLLIGVVGRVALIFRMVFKALLAPITGFRSNGRRGARPRLYVCHL